MKVLHFKKPLKNDFHARIVSFAKTKKITILKVDEQTYYQRYTFVREDETAVFDAYFNKNNRFTTCMPQMNSCSEKRGPESLFDEVQGIMTIELSK